MGQMGSRDVYKDLFTFQYTLDIQPPEKVFCVYIWGVQIPSQQVFGCLGYGYVKQ